MHRGSSRQLHVLPGNLAHGEAQGDANPKSCTKGCEEVHPVLHGLPALSSMFHEEEMFVVPDAHKDRMLPFLGGGTQQYVFWR